MDEITEIKKQILLEILKREGDILAIQSRIQTVIDTATATFARGSKILEERYAESNGSGEEFMKELKAFQDKITIATKSELDKILDEVSATSPKS